MDDARSPRRAPSTRGRGRANSGCLKPRSKSFDQGQSKPDARPGLSKSVSFGHIDRITPHTVLQQLPFPPRVPSPPPPPPAQTALSRRAQRLVGVVRFCAGALVRSSQAVGALVLVLALRSLLRARKPRPRALVPRLAHAVAALWFRLSQ